MKRSFRYKIRKLNDAFVVSATPIQPYWAAEFPDTDLITQHFLHTDQVSFVKPNNTSDSVPTVCPGMLSIRRIVVADIERHDIERRVHCGKPAVKR